jgi:DNA polymerase III subunit delta
MQLRPHQLSEHLRKPLAPVYVVAGEEPLLLQEALDALRATARQQGYSERQVLDVDTGFDWSRLTEACASLSLFASRRLIELRMPGSPGDEGGKLLRELAARPPADTVLLVVCGKLDGRQRKTAWFTALENAGASLYLWPVKREELPQWIGRRLRDAGLKADAAAIQLLAERTEGNLLAAAQDIEKLRLLFPGQMIGEEDMRSVVADSAHFESFDLSEKVLSGDATGAVRSLHRLREEGVELPALLGAWAWTLRQWAQASVLYARSGNAVGACEALKIYGSRQPPYLKALPRARPAQVHAWLARCLLIDSKAKSTGGEPAAWEDLLTSVLAASGASR